MSFFLSKALATNQETKFTEMMMLLFFHANVCVYCVDVATQLGFVFLDFYPNDAYGQQHFMTG